MQEYLVTLKVNQEELSCLSPNSLLKIEEVPEEPVGFYDKNRTNNIARTGRNSKQKDG